MAEGLLSAELFEQTQAYLLRTGEDGRSVYDQLCLLFEKLLKDGEELTENPEELLQRLGAQQLKYDVHTGDVIADEEVPSASEEEARRARALCIRALRRQAQPSQQQQQQEVSVQSLVEDLRYFEMAGAGLSLNEARALQASMRTLAVSRSLTHCRLFGKFLGLRGNYYVVESSYVPAEGEGQPEDPDALKPFELPMVELPAEEPRFGANQRTYWVCAMPGGAWARLPNVTPAQIGAARKIRKLLTGDLQADVVSYPPFPGDEAVYLRAQIARIGAATEVAPAGYYMVVEQEEDEVDEDGNPVEQVPEGPKLEPDEGFEGVEMEELGTLDGWVHAKGFLLDKQSRVHLWTKPEKEEDEEGEGNEEDEDEEEEPEEEEEEEPEEELPLMGSLAEDKPLYKVRPPGEEPAGEDGDEAEEEDEADEDEEGGSRTRTMPRWLIRQPLRLALGAASPVVLANSKWKGAVAFADDRGNKFGNLYVGYGVPTSLQAFAPDLLGELQVEGAGATMVKEPSYRDEEKLLTDTLSEDEDPEFE